MMKNLIQNIFSVKNEKYHKVITILGLKIKLFHPKSDDLYYCPICKKYGHFTKMGVKPRYAVKCPNCKSLERHRFLYFIYQKYFLNTNKPIKILHTAPEKGIYNLIKKNLNIEYTAIDISPERYSFCDCKKEDVTDLSFADNTFDFVISNQVMEHILDEKKYLSELTRVLKPDGVFLLNFPVFMDRAKTFQDDSVTTPEDREKYYGQNDHVRAYGRDVFERLKRDYGAKVIFAKDILNKEQLRKYRVSNRGTDFCVVIKKF